MNVLAEFLRISSQLTATELAEVIPEDDLARLARHHLAALKDYDAAGTHLLLTPHARVIGTEREDLRTADLEQFIVELWYTGTSSRSIRLIHEPDAFSARAMACRYALFWQVCGSLAKGVPRTNF